MPSKDYDRIVAFGLGPAILMNSPASGTDSYRLAQTRARAEHAAG